MFALAAIAVKLATAELEGVDLIGSALGTLVVVMAIQTGLHLLWVALRDRDTLCAVFRTWRNSSRVGLLSALGSACWYTAFTAAPEIGRASGRERVRRYVKISVVAVTYKKNKNI